MARLPRLALPGLAHLTVLRGLPGQALFVDDVDRAAFISALREASLQHRVAVEGYTLADDHVHLLLRPADGPALGAVVQGLGRRYVPALNRRHARHGSPWAGRFRAAALQPGEAVRDALLFIDGHAWRAGRVEHAGDERFSSAAHHLGRWRDPLVTDGPDWWALGNTPFDREAAWRQRLAEGLAPTQLRALAEASHKGWPMGDAAFVAQLAQQTSRPLAPRARGRPRTAR